MKQWGRPHCDWLHSLLWLVCMGFLCAPSALAERYNDLTITAQAPPSANTTHGYAEYRVSLFNDSAAQTHVVDLALPARSYGYRHHIQRMTRRVVVPPQTEVKVSLWQPPVGMSGDDMGVTIDGRSQDAAVSLTVAGHGEMNYYGYRGGMPTMFVLTSRSVPGQVRDNLEQLLEKEVAAGAGSSSYYGGAPDKAVTLVRAETEVADWSDNWLSYSRYDGLLLTQRDLQAMSSDVRQAIWSYVTCGGTLLVLGDMQPPGTWAGEQDPSDEHCMRYEVGFGRAWQVDPDAAPQWSDSQLKVLENELWRPSANRWASRMSIADANKQFPVVDKLQIPARGMLTLMIVFAVLVGPVNLIVLSKLNKRIWTLATVPLLAVLFSAAVFAYAIAAEGLSASGRAATITLLDENAHRATTLGWIGYYSPLTPGGGLHFSDHTEVTPQLGDLGWSNEGSSRLVDWTNDQHLTAGWITARVPSHFVVRKSAVQRERLALSRDDKGNLVAVNGLGSDIVRLTLVDDDGRLYRGEHIAAGQKCTLEPVTDVQLPDIVPSLPQLYQQSTWIASLIQLSGDDPTDLMRRGTYIAVLADEPFLEPGLAKMKAFKTEAVVYGILPRHKGAGE